MSRYATCKTFTADGTVNLAAFIKYNGSNTSGYTVLNCGLGDIPTAGIGDLQADNFSYSGQPGTPVCAVLGEVVEAYIWGCQVPLTAGGTWPGAGSFLKPDANGFGIVANPGDVYGAISLCGAAAGDIPEVVVCQPSVVPTTGGAINSIAASSTLASGGTVYVTAADVVVTLPPVASKATVRVVTNAATGTLTGATGAGTLIKINPADVTAGNVKMFGHDITTPAFSKGLVNTKATAIQGDTCEVRSDGFNWFEFPVNGTWTREA